MMNNYFLILFFGYLTLVSSTFDFDIYESIFHFNGFNIDDLKKFSSFQSLKDTQTPIFFNAFTNLFQSNFKYLDIIDIELTGLSKESPDTVIFTGQLYIDKTLNRNDIIKKINKNGPLTIFKLSHTLQYTYLHRGKSNNNNNNSYIFEDQTTITFGSCQNGGVLLPNSTCECKDYFNGKNCENIVCLNSGIPTKNGHCICPPGFISPHCEPLSLTQPTQYSFDFSDKSFIYVINLRDSMSEDIQYVVQNTKNILSNNVTLKYKNFILTTYVSNANLGYNFIQSTTYTSLNDFLVGLESITFVYGDLEQPTLSAIYNTLSTQTSIKGRSNIIAYCDSVSSLSTGYNISQIATNSLEYNITNALINWNIRLYFSLTSISTYPLNKNSDGYLVYGRLSSASFGQVFDFASSKGNVNNFVSQIIPYLLNVDIVSYGYQVTQSSFTISLNTSDDYVNIMIIGSGSILNQTPNTSISSISIYTISKNNYGSIGFQVTGSIDYYIFSSIKNTIVPGFTIIPDGIHSEVDVYSFNLINEFPMKPVMYGYNIASSTMKLQSTVSNNNIINIGTSTPRNTQQIGMFNYVFNNQISTCSIGYNIITIQFTDSLTNNIYTRIFPTLCQSPYDLSGIPLKCQNGGSVNSQGNGCDCTPDYVGNVCQTPLCYNGGSVNRYPTGTVDQCICINGFSGNHCEKDSCSSQQVNNFDISHKTISIVMANVSSQAYLAPIISTAIQGYMNISTKLNPNYVTQFTLTTYSNITDIVTGNSLLNVKSSIYQSYDELINGIITNKFPYSSSNSQNSIQGLIESLNINLQYNRKRLLFWFIDQYTIEDQNDQFFEDAQITAITNQIPINIIYAKPFNPNSSINTSICTTGNNKLEGKLSQLAYTTGGVILDLCKLTNTNNIQNLFTTFGMMNYKLENIYQTNLQQCNNNQVTTTSFSSDGKKFILINSNTQNSLTLSIYDNNGIQQQVNNSISNTPSIFLYDITSLQKNIKYTISVTSQNQGSCLITIMEESDISPVIAFTKSVAVNYNDTVPKFGIPYHPVIHLPTKYQNITTIELSDVLKYSTGAYDNFGILRSSTCSFDYFYDSQYACNVTNSPFYLTATITANISSTQTITAQRSILSYCNGPPNGGCLNNGLLSNGTCICPYNYIGRYCEQPLCYNGGTSSQNQCKCLNNYFGTFCQYIGCDSMDYKTLNDVNKFSYNTIIFVVENTVDSGGMRNDLITNIPIFVNMISQNSGGKEFVLVTVDDVNSNNVIVTPDSSYFNDVFVKTLSNTSSTTTGQDVKTLSGIEAALQYSLYKPTIIYVFTSNGASDKNNVYSVTSKIGNAYVQINYIYVPKVSTGAPKIPTSTKYIYTQLLSYGSGGRLIPINSGNDLSSLILNYLPLTIQEDGIVEDRYVDDSSKTPTKLFFPVENQTEWFTISVTGKNVNNLNTLKLYNGNGKLVSPKQYETIVSTTGYVVIKISRISFTRNYHGQWKIEGQTSSGPIRIQIRITSSIHVKIGFSGSEINDHVSRLPGILTTSPTQNYITAHLPYNMFMNNGIFLESARVYSIVMDSETTTDISMFTFNSRNPDTCSYQYVSPNISIPKMSIPNVLMVQVNGQDQYSQSIQRLFFYTPSQINCVHGSMDMNGFCVCNSQDYEGIDCNKIICKNGGTSDGSVCYCPPGYWGDLCQKILSPSAITTIQPPSTKKIAPPPSPQQYFTSFFCDKSFTGVNVIQNQLNIINTFFNGTGNNISTSILIESQGQDPLTNNFTIIKSNDFTLLNNQIQNVLNQKSASGDITFLKLLHGDGGGMNMSDGNIFTKLNGLVLFINSNVYGIYDTITTFNQIKQLQNNGLKILAIVFDQQYMSIGDSLTGGKSNVYLYQTATTQPQDTVTWILQQLSLP